MNSRTPPADIVEEPAGIIARPGFFNRYQEYVYLLYLVIYPLPWFGRTPDNRAVVASLVGVAIFLALYLYGYRRGGTARLLACAGILVVGFALQPFGGIWGVFPVYSAALAALLPGWRAIAAMLSIGLLVAAFAIVLALPLWEWIPTLFLGGMAGVSALYAAILERTNRELAASREEARRLSITAERERIARDLHDVLGQTLTLVAVKADLAGRLLGEDVNAARREIEDIRQTARSALADVRAAVTGMRAVTLATELSAARHALESAGIRFTHYIAPGPLSQPVEMALAFVVREAVTNVIRHSCARECTISLVRYAETVGLEIRDNGRASATSEGNGLAGMRQRVAALRGSLEIDHTSGGTHVRASLPASETYGD